MDRFETFCGRIQKMLDGEKAVFRKIEIGRELLSELTSRPEWFFDYLKKTILEPAAAEIRKQGIWPNEFTLFRSPDKSFVVLSYIWDAKLADIVHDHGSWGIIGTLAGKLGEKKFERLDDGKKEGYGEIRQTTSGLYGPGETTFVLPLGEGLHAMDNPTDGIAVSVNVYGKTMGRGYIQFFDQEKKAVTRVYPPRTQKEVLAVKTLAAIDPSRAEDVLRKALSASPSPALQQAFKETLAKIRNK